jgi:hypothetical protein
MVRARRDVLRAMHSRPWLLALALVAASCKRAPRVETLTVVHPPRAVDTAQLFPDLLPLPSATATKQPPAPEWKEWKEPPKQLALASRLTLTAARHGVDARLDVYREQQDVDYLPSLDTILKLVPTSGPPSNLTFRNAHEPRAYTQRFGDRATESVVIEYDARWVTGFGHDLVVVELEDGKPVWRHATHAVTGARHPVEARLHTVSGGPQHMATVRGSASGGAEILAVFCGEVGPKKACTSTNRVFYVKDGKWWWNEQEGTACKPKDNGWCAATVALFPDRSEFPGAS